METLNNLEMDNPCDYCGRKNRKTVGLMMQEKHFTCTCGRLIFVNMKQLDALISNMESSLAPSQARG